jgi:hypothetical protein
VKENEEGIDRSLMKDYTFKITGRIFGKLNLNY